MITKKDKSRLLLLVFLIATFLFIGCKKDTDYNSTFNEEDKVKVEDTNNETQLKDKKEKESENDQLDILEEVPTDQDVDGGGSDTNTEKTKMLSIYTVDSESLELKDVNVMVSDSNEITPELIVNQVISKLAESELIIGIDKLTMKDDIIIVSFKKDEAPFSNTGSSAESAVLDAIGMSLLDNLTEYKKIVYQVEGNAYESGHIELEIDEIYIES